MWSSTFYVISVLVVLGGATDWQVERRPRFLDLDWILKEPKNSTKLPFWMPVHTKFQCEKTGFFPDKFNCKQFYRCLSFLTGYFLRHTYVCDGNRVYSSKLQNCVDPEKNDRPECIVGLKESSTDQTSTVSVEETKEPDEQELSRLDNITLFENGYWQDVENSTKEYVTLVKRQVGNDDSACDNANEENSEELDDESVNAFADICPREESITVQVDATTQGSAAKVNTMGEQSTTVQVDTTTHQGTTVQTDVTTQSITVKVDTTERQSTVVQGSTEEQDTIVQDSTEQQDTIVEGSTEQDTVIEGSTEQDTVIEGSTEQDTVIEGSTEQQSTTEQVHETEKLVTEQIGTTEQITQQAYTFETSEEIRHNTERMQTTEESTTHIDIPAKMATKSRKIIEKQQGILKDNVNVESVTVTETSQTSGTEIERIFESTTVDFEEDGSSDDNTVTGDEEVAQHSTTSASFVNEERNDERKEQICVEEGFFADARNCSKFYRCVRFGFVFLKHEFTCAVGTIWDDRLKTCNFLAGVELNNVSCKYDANRIAQNRLSETETELSTNDLIRDQLTFVCPTGIRRHSKYCNLFYQCILNDRFQMNFTTFACPEGTFFNEKRVQCLESKEDKDCLYFRIDEKRSPIEILHFPKRDLCPDEGQFPYGVICSNRYLECVRNSEGNLEGYIFDCPAGHVYSPMSIGCLPSTTFPACVH